jgi:hypothetical protein
MLGNSGDSLITRLTSILSADKAAVPSASPPTPAAEAEPYSTLAAATAYDTATNESRSKNNTREHRLTVSPRRSMRRSASEGVVPVRAPSPSSHSVSVVRFSEGEAPSADTTQRSMASLQSQRPTAYRSTSSPQVKLQSHYHDPAISSESLQKELVEQTRPSSSRPVRSGGVHRVPTAGGSIIAKRPSPTRSTPMRSSSDPDLAKAFTHPKARRGSFPLKPCIKKKAKSTTPRPPSEFVRDDVSHERRPLRRVKTVDFEGSGPKSSLSLPQVLPASEGPTLKPTIEPPPSYASKSKKNGNRFSSCPNTISTIKSSTADPAVTRTDVHVIAIAPSWNA